VAVTLTYKLFVSHFRDYYVRLFLKSFNIVTLLLMLGIRNYMASVLQYMLWNSDLTSMRCHWLSESRSFEGKYFPHLQGSNGLEIRQQAPLKHWEIPQPKHNIT
jgi:hypothetical protein